MSRAPCSTSPAAMPGQLGEVTPGGAFTWRERGGGGLSGLAGGPAAGRGGGWPVRIEMRDERPPVSPEALAAAKARLAELGHAIPPSYRAFLADQDGGDPVRECFSFRQGDREQEDRVRWFYGIAESPNGDLVKESRAWSTAFPPGSCRSPGTATATR